LSFSAVAAAATRVDDARVPGPPAFCEQVERDGRHDLVALIVRARGERKWPRSMLTGGRKQYAFLLYRRRPMEIETLGVSFQRFEPDGRAPFVHVFLI